jgi:hypothetical protein
MTEIHQTLLAWAVAIPLVFFFAWLHDRRANRQ